MFGITIMMEDFTIKIVAGTNQVVIESLNLQ